MHPTKEVDVIMANTNVNLWSPAILGHGIAKGASRVNAARVMQAWNPVNAPTLQPQWLEIRLFARGGPFSCGNAGHRGLTDGCFPLNRLR